MTIILTQEQLDTLISQTVIGDCKKTKNEPCFCTLEGTCHCGCNGKTKEALQSVTSRGYIKGQPKKFLHNHSKSRTIEGNCKKGHFLSEDNIHLYTNPNGKKTRKCKTCQKINGYARRYHISVEQFNLLLKEKNSACAICDVNLDYSSTGEKKEHTGNILCVDHDHNTNRIRGLLCHRCNTGIGLLQHSTDIIISALEYIRKYDSRDP